MKEKYLTNARIIDPKNQIDEMGGLIIDAKGLIKAAGKKVTNGNLPAAAEKIDLNFFIFNNTNDRQHDKPANCQKCGNHRCG